MQMLKEEMEDIKEKNNSLMKTHALAETLQEQLSVSQRRNSELITEKNQSASELEKLQSKLLSNGNMARESTDDIRELENLRNDLSTADRANSHLQNLICELRRKNISIKNRCIELENSSHRTENIVQQFQRRLIIYEEENRNLGLQLRQGKKSINVRNYSANNRNQHQYRLWRQNESSDKLANAHDRDSDNVSQDKIKRKEGNRNNLTEVDLTFSQSYKPTFKSEGEKDVLVVGCMYNRDLIDTMFVTKRSRTMAVLNKKMDTTVARDMIRCRVMETFFNLNIKETITLNTVSNQPCQGHHYMDVSNRRSISEFSRNKINSYDFVYIDYYRANDNYYGTRLLNPSFFEVTLRHMHRMLKSKGKVIIPFFPRIIANMLPHLHQLARIFNIQYLKREQLYESENYLWRTTEMMTEIKNLKYLMTGEKCAKQCFGNVSKKRIKAFISDTTCNDSVDLFCDNLPEIEKIYFIQFVKHNATNSECLSLGNKRQVRGKDFIFIPSAERFHQITINERLTSREIHQMYTGVKLVFAINPNLNVPLKNGEGYLAIVKFEGVIRLGVCHNDFYYGLTYFILKDIKYVQEFSTIFTSTKLINHHCDVIPYATLGQQQPHVLKGYFVNEIFKGKRDNKSVNKDMILTISSLSPDIVKIPERNVLSHECISLTKKYTVVYIPHDQLAKCKSLDKEKHFLIPFKLEILNNKW